MSKLILEVTNEYDQFDVQEYYPIETKQSKDDIENILKNHKDELKNKRYPWDATNLIICDRIISWISFYDNRIPLVYSLEEWFEKYKNGQNL